MATGKSKLEVEISAINTATAEVDKLQDSLKKTTTAQGEANKTTKEGSEINKQAKEGLNGMVESVTGLNLAQITLAGSMVAVVEGMKKSVEAAVELGDATENFGRLTGMSADQSSAMIGVMKVFGLSADDVSRALQAAVRKGYEPSAAGLAQLRKEYQAIQSPIEQSKFLMDTFGRSGTKLAEYLSQDSERLAEVEAHVRTVGLVMGDDGVEKTQKYAQEVTMLEQQFEGLKVQVGMAVIPTLTHAIEVTNLAADAERKQGLTLLDFLPIAAQVREAQRLVTAEKERNTKATNETATAENLAGIAMVNAADNTNILTNATKENKDNLDKLKGGWNALPPAMQAYISSADEARAANDKLNTQIRDDLTLSMQKYSKELLYKTAAEGLSSEAALQLATSMGLIDEKTKFAADRTAELKQQLINGEITLEEYTRLINGMANGLDRIQSKSVTIEVNMVTRGFSGQGGLQDDTGGYTPVDAYGHTSVPLQKEAPKTKSGGAQAIGGWFGPGSYLRGEMGPEVTKEHGFGQTINNYESTYNLTAHYPKYQDEHAARNDLIAMTMLKNQGAAKWAS